MGKSGLLKIGYIKNIKDYPTIIRNKIGKYYDYAAFDKRMERIWENQTTEIYFYDCTGREVLADSDQIAFFLIDTGFEIKESSEMLFVGFCRDNPGKIDDSTWRGVTIGSKPELISNYLMERDRDIPCLENYTWGIDYEKIALIIRELTGEAISKQECKTLLNTSYERAVEAGELTVLENQYDNSKRISFFPLVQNKSADEVQLFVAMEKNRVEASTVKWYGAYIKTREELLDDLLSYFCFHIGYFYFATPNQANLFFNNLAKKAMRENWKWKDASKSDSTGLPILKSYLEHTYYRLLEEDTKSEKKKIISIDGLTYFNSGLLDRNFRQIIIVGTNKLIEKEIKGIGKCNWNLLMDLESYSHNEHEIASMFNKDELPAIASYFTDYRQVVFDAGLDIHTNDRHIFEDGVARDRLPKYKEEYENVKDDQKELELFLARIARDFDSAIERARLMAERNYKLAVPQFYRETGEIQFLLPIYLGEREEAERPQCALVLRLDTSGRRPYYSGVTILTLAMAYNNTRLIAKPDVFWLNEIVDE